MSKKGGDNKPSKKAKQEKQNKQIEDATFGLKNKNKSKKVQQFINRVEKSVKHSGGGLENTKAKELKKEAKLAKQLEEEQMRQLFNEAIGNQYGVNKKKAASNAAMLGLNTVKKEVSDFLDTLSSDSSDSDSDDGGYRRNQPREIILDDDEDSPQGVEIFREKTIEDLIEEQRAKLAAEGKKGTPVTEESFAVWRAEKLRKKQAEMEARVKAEQTKRKGGKGLSVLSGKELFSFNSSLFVDDEAALDTSNDEVINEEILALRKQEEERIKEETERAQAEQLRLFEIRKAEIDARKAREEDKKNRANAANHPTCIFCGVTVNVVVFQEEEEEDLDFFNDLPLPYARPARDDAAVEGVREGMEKVSVNKNNNSNTNQEEGDEVEGEGEGDGEEDEGEEGEDDEEG